MTHGFFAEVCDTAFNELTQVVRNEYVSYSGDSVHHMEVNCDGEVALIADNNALVVERLADNDDNYMGWTATEYCWVDGAWSFSDGQEGVTFNSLRNILRSWFASH